MPKRLTDDQILEIVKLAQAGNSIANISRKLGLKKTTVYYHARSYCRKMTKLDLDLLTEFEKGYLVGFFLGDGNLNMGRKTPRYIVRFFLDAERDQDISTYLCQVLQKGRKKVSVFTRKTNTILKVSSKELVDFMQKYIEYERNWDHRLEKRLKKSTDWSSELQYGILSGIIDSDGHVHGHLGTEIKTASSLTQRRILDILTNLRIDATSKVKDVTENSFSKRPRHVIYIPSAEMKAHQNRIRSVKVRRYL